MFGGNGFVGKALVRALMLADPGLSLNVPTSREINLLEPIEIQGDCYDYIIHLAAYTQAGSFCREFPFDQFVINNSINLNVIKFWQEKAPSSKLIAVGTSVSYDPNVEMVEGNYLIGEPIEMYQSYAYSKRNLLVGMLSAGKQYGLEYIYYIPSTLVGESYPYDGRQLHFIYDIARKFFEFKNGKTKNVELIGDPNTVREVLNVNDFCAMLLMTMGLKNEIFNVGSLRNFTIQKLADDFSRLFGIDTNCVRFGRTQGFGAKSKYLNSSKIYSITNHQEISYEETLNEIVSWTERFYK